MPFSAKVGEPGRHQRRDSATRAWHAVGMVWLREINRWLAERVLPFAPDYRRLAKP